MPSSDNVYRLVTSPSSQNLLLLGNNAVVAPALRTSRDQAANSEGTLGGSTHKISARNLVAKPEHREHGRAVGWFMDRYFHEEYHQQIYLVHHEKFDDRKFEELARRFALELQIPVERFLGKPAVVIEGSTVDVKAEERRNAD